MLQLRPNCEWCDADLPPQAPNAMICSYECTYCATCVRDVLHDVCPTCGGGFAPRPVRPARAHRAGLSLGLAHHPASATRTHSRWTAAEVAELAALLRDTPPSDR